MLLISDFFSAGEALDLYVCAFLIRARVGLGHVYVQTSSRVRFELFRNRSGAFPGATFGAP